MMTPNQLDAPRPARRTLAIVTLWSLVCGLGMVSCRDRQIDEATAEQQLGPDWEWVPPSSPPYAEPPIPDSTTSPCEPECNGGTFRCLAPCGEDTEDCPPVSLYTVPCVTGCFVDPGAAFPHGGCLPPACGSRALGSTSCSSDKAHVEACVLNTSPLTVLGDGTEVPSGQPLGAVVVPVDACSSGTECVDRVVETIDTATGQPTAAHLVGCIPKARCPFGDSFMVPGDVTCSGGQRLVCPTTVTGSSQGPVPAGACPCTGDDRLLRCASGNEVCGGRCDGTNDCSDGSDEASCPCEGFLCGSGECVTSSQRCNGTSECTDGSDEFCEPCGDGFRCASDASCVPAAAVCDGPAQCNDGSDEAGCGSQDCDSFFDFQCNSGDCVWIWGVCDGVPDCADGSDETGPQCGTCLGRFQCTTGECMPWSLVCDGLPHCSNAEDEGTELCASFPGPPPLPPEPPDPGGSCDLPDAGVDAGIDAPVDDAGSNYPDSYHDAHHDAGYPDGGYLCGNGSVDPGEQCDGTPTATCWDLGYMGGGVLGCSSGCTYDTSGCEMDYCGDGYASGMEACDGDDLNDMTCEDQGYAGGTLACTATCSYDTSACNNDPADAGVDGGLDAGGDTPDAGGDVPDAGGGTPDAGGSTPDAGGGTPDAGGGTPDAGGGTPDAGGGMPDAGGGMPDAGGGMPDAGGGTPDAGGGGTPDAGGGLPDAGGGSGGGGYCGDGVVGSGESCDGSNLQGQTCAGLGYTGGGSLGCFWCSYDTSGCQMSMCGDAFCDANEGCSSCPGDCGACSGDAGTSHDAGTPHDAGTIDDAGAIDDAEPIDDAGDASPAPDDAGPIEVEHQEVGS